MEKVFCNDESRGRVPDHLDVPDDYGTTPIRIEDNGDDGNRIFILHVDKINGYCLSFFKSEIPDE